MTSSTLDEPAEPAEQGAPDGAAAGDPSPPAAAAPTASPPAEAAPRVDGAAAAAQQAEEKLTPEEAIAKAREECLKEMRRKLYIGKISQKSMKRKGLLNWPEGGSLDSWDKGLSYCIFRLDFGIAVEICLSCASLWFGVLTFTLCILPVVLVAVSPGPTWRFTACVLGPWLGLMVGWWPQRCINSSIGGNSVAKKLLELKPGMCFAGPYLCMGAARYAESSAGMAAVELFFCSYYITSTLVSVLHGLVWRPRPLASGVGQELKRYDRSLQDAAIAVHIDTLVNLSFPSAPAANAAVWSACLALAAPLWLGLPVAALVLLASAFGNVYFRLHYVLDVLAGQAIGLATTLLLSASGCASWMVLVALQLLTGLTLGHLHKFLWPQVPENPRKQTLMALQLIKEKLT